MSSVIIGIDPGPTHSAYVKLRDGKIAHHAKYENSKLLEILIYGHPKRLMAVEFLQSFGMPVGKEVFETAYLIGRIQQLASEYNIRLVPVYRKQVVLHHCQSPRAKDANVRQAMLDRWGPQGTKKAPGATYGISADIWSALAIATYAMDCEVLDNE